MPSVAGTRGCGRAENFPVRQQVNPDGIRPQAVLIVLVIPDHGWFQIRGFHVVRVCHDLHVGGSGFRGSIPIHLGNGPLCAGGSFGAAGPFVSCVQKNLRPVDRHHDIAGRADAFIVVLVLPAHGDDLDHIRILRGGSQYHAARCQHQYAQNGKDSLQPSFHVFFSPLV